MAKPGAGPYKNTPHFRFVDPAEKYMLPSQSFTPVELPELPERTEDDFKIMKKLVDNVTLVKEGACLVYRHRTPLKSKGGIHLTHDAVSQQNKKRVTGTILKLKAGYDGPLKVGDRVFFTMYAPFSAFEEYEELQLIHYDDIIMTLVDLPSEVTDESGRLL